MLDKVVHNLTHRRFKNTSRQSVYELGSAVANSFFDPRNVGNFEAGEIAPEGNYLTHYPVNAASNTMGFSIMDDQGDDRRSYYPSQVFNSGNALVKEKKSGGSLGGPSNGSSSDYIYFNPYYQALLNPQSHTTMSDINQQHFIPRNTLLESSIEGRGTNAPSSASAIDYAMNNPYAFPSNFNGGALGAASSGSSSDYYDSNPNRVPAIQSETRHYTDFMTEGGAIDWGRYLGYIRQGAQKIAPHIPTIIEHAPQILEGVKAVHSAVKDVNKEKGFLNKASAVAKHAPKIYSTIDTIRDLRNSLKGNKRTSNKSAYDGYVNVDMPEEEVEYKSKKSKSKSKSNEPEKKYSFMKRADYLKLKESKEAKKPFRTITDKQREAESQYQPREQTIPEVETPNIQLKISEKPKKKYNLKIVDEFEPKKEVESKKETKPKGKVGRPKKEKEVKPKGKVGRPSKKLRTMNLDI